MAAARKRESGELRRTGESARVQAANLNEPRRRARERVIG